MTTVKDQWGMCCPVCEEDYNLSVDFIGTAELTPDGTVDAGDHEWGDDSVCWCSCGWKGHVCDARVANQVEKPL
jgi:hypothetical protein